MGVESTEGPDGCGPISLCALLGKFALCRVGMSSGWVIGAFERAVAASSCSCCCFSRLVCALIFTKAISAAVILSKSTISW